MSREVALTEYLPLLSIEVAHAYFADGRCRGLRFTPTAATGEWLEAQGAVVRDTGSGLVVFAPLPKLQAIAEPPTMLAWSVRATDTMFASVSEKFDLEEGRKILFFSRDGVDPTADTVWRLHEGEAASQADLCHVRSPVLRCLLTDAERRLPPSFVVRVAAPAPGSTGPHGVRFRIAFAARAPVWKYCLIGAWSSRPKELEVVGAHSDPAFGAAEDDALDNGQPMLALRSASGIALAERSERRFQLRERSPRGDRVLVERLPVAGAGHFTRETNTDPPTLVCAIYVHANPLRRPLWQQ